MVGFNREKVCAVRVERGFAIISLPCMRAGRAVAAAHQFALGRKVRTLQGNEPANGGASGAELLESRRDSLAFSENQPGDDKCNRKQTSRSQFETYGRENADS